IAGPQYVDPDSFAPHPRWGLRRHAHELTEPNGQSVTGSSQVRQSYVPGLGAFGALAGPDFPVRDLPESFARNRADQGRRGDCQPHLTGDFDTGTGAAPDGPYINRPDEGEYRGYRVEDPYYEVPDPERLQVPDPEPHGVAAHRLMPSPVMFGSLPTGVRAKVPWQTLLFRPQPGHYGASSPPDHLFLDLFWMPTLEPRPMSGICETEGQINLNHRLEPFHHIRRTTASHALLKSEQMLAIPDGAMDGGEASLRLHIDAEKTLSIWDKEVFDEGRTFLSASQICQMPLVPEGAEGSRSAMNQFWQGHRRTGDNVRERPYAHLYPRLTVRSNTYRLHFIAQSIQKSRSANPATFETGVDLIRGETVGSRLIRRQVANREGLSDFLSSGNLSLRDHVRFEVE
ncbi:MAG: hypothetical protein AAF514_24210, partial [Verrucomicrobiota bacterium]